MEEANKVKPIEEFQDIFESVFRKLKKGNEFFPKTDYKLAAGHMFILLHLYKKGSCTASDISSYLGITSAGVTGLTDTLEKNNLINRNRSENDRRVVHLSLTNKGEKLVEQVMSARVNLFVQVFKDFEEKEIEQITNVFKKLDRILTNNNPLN
ncbi:MarR family winged helix-turn-helix transcriptional regulator [Paenibacillus arenilitoris]|uniref:MarR family transcriptional regulator n=1 Tax=Paenibacillus arenilitoris TaxID=2772299 RepID=A0A927H6R3_9BACL|nr:MarR family transcriptional regulator [Paenibacillus arenilitoris]MBD2868834.1 MarR family transcriptional regulator [Paenibacillus arenilitoris]